jgi:hypothetical protein
MPSTGGREMMYSQLPDTGVHPDVRYASKRTSGGWRSAYLALVRVDKDPGRAQVSFRVDTPAACALLGW